jgi:hypothetical protein
MNTPSEVGGVLARIVDGLPTPRAIDDCSPRQPTIFYRSLTRRTIYDTPSTVAGTREAPSTLRVNDGMRTRSAARGVRQGSWHPSSESGNQNRVSNGLDWRYYPGTVEESQQLLPSPGQTSSPTTGGHVWSDSPYSMP